jgi:hypothetical protein
VVNRCSWYNFPDHQCCSIDINLLERKTKVSKIGSFYFQSLITLKIPLHPLALQDYKD